MHSGISDNDFDEKEVTQITATSPLPSVLKRSTRATSGSIPGSTPSPMPPEGRPFSPLAFILHSDTPEPTMETSAREAITPNLETTEHVKIPTPRTLAASIGAIISDLSTTVSFPKETKSNDPIFSKDFANVLLTAFPITQKVIAGRECIIQQKLTFTPPPDLDYSSEAYVDLENLKETIRRSFKEDSLLSELRKDSEIAKILSLSHVNQEHLLIALEKFLEKQKLSSESSFVCTNPVNNIIFVLIHIQHQLRTQGLRYLTGESKVKQDMQVLSLLIEVYSKDKHPRLLAKLNGTKMLLDNLRLYVDQEHLVRRMSESMTPKAVLFLAKPIHKRTRSRSSSVYEPPEVAVEPPAPSEPQTSAQTTKPEIACPPPSCTVM